ncbi:MAG TPA: lipid A biosynthesis acyltransferase, partial [Gammaproteobacteria bacterium]|nr:lipid A biosynthesis acyltransferase [Gammaproteobacteria bacterium]
MIKFILTFFSILPLRINHFIGAMIGRYLSLTNSDSKKVVSKNIQTCFPDLSDTEQQNLVKRSEEHTS